MVDPSSDAGSITLPVRLLKVFVSPGELFESLKQRPLWGGVLAIGGLLVVASLLLIPAEVWISVMREQSAETGAELPGFLRSAGAVFRIATAAGAAIFWFLWAFVLAGIVTFVFAFFLGDEGRYREYLSVVSHALFIGAVGAVLLTPLRIIQQQPDLTLNVGTFFSFLGEGYTARVLRLLDLFGLWSYTVMAIGVTKIYPNRGMGSALTFFWGFALVFALIVGIIPR